MCRCIFLIMHMVWVSPNCMHCEIVNCTANWWYKVWIPIRKFPGIGIGCFWVVLTDLSWSLTSLYSWNVYPQPSITCTILPALSDRSRENQGYGRFCWVLDPYPGGMDMVAIIGWWLYLCHNPRLLHGHFNWRSAVNGILDWNKSFLMQLKKVWLCYDSGLA